MREIMSVTRLALVSDIEVQKADEVYSAPVAHEPGKTNKKTHGSNQRLTAPLTHLTFRCQTHCREGHSAVILDNSNVYAAAAARKFRTLTEADRSSQNKQWFNLKLTMYNIHCPATWDRWHNDKKVWPGQGLTPVYTWRSRSWRWHLAADPHTGEHYSRIGRTNA